jgi:predicted dehydrogenase
MTSDVRVGLIGAGYIAGVHSAAYRAVKGTFPTMSADVALAAVADVDRDRARSVADAWGWAESTDDWRRVTRADDLDLVDICVPNALHAEIAIDALEHGKHVVCEKPLAADAHSAEQMVAAAAGSDLVSDVCFYYRLWPAVQHAHNLIAAARIGEIVHARGWMLQDYGRRQGASMGWRGDAAQAGAGALGDLGSHIFDVLRFLVGDVRRVCSMARSTIERPSTGPPVDDMVAALLDFDRGASGVLEASWAMAGHRCDLGFDVVGSTGAIRFSWERSNELEVLTDDGAGRGFERVLVGPDMPGVGEMIAVAGQGLGYRDAFTIGLGSAIEGATGQRGQPGPTFEDGLAACRFVEAVQASAAAGQWVDVDVAQPVSAV